MDHGGGDEVQGVMAQGQSVAFLDDDAAVSIVCAEELLHHDKGLGGRYNFSGGVCLGKGIDGTGVVRLHVLDNQVVRCTITQCGGDLGDPLVSKVGVNGVHHNGLVVHDQIGVVGHAVRDAILAFKEIHCVIIDTKVNNIFCDFHSGFLP